MLEELLTALVADLNCQDFHVKHFCEYSFIIIDQSKSDEHKLNFTQLFNDFLLLTEVEFHLRELIEVLGVIDGGDIDREGCGALPDVVPVNASHEGQLLDLTET